MTELDIQRNYCSGLLWNIAFLRSGDKFCDIDVEVNGKVFRCHRLVLIAASNYFDVMFNGYFKEGSAMKIVLQDIAANVFEGILQFMYSGYVMIRKSDEVYDMIRAAEFFGLPSLVELCTLFVEKNPNAMTHADILKIFSFARTAGLKQLIQVLAGYIYKNFGNFSTFPDFNNLTFDCLVEVLNLMDGKLHGDVQDLFVEGIYTWVTHQRNLTTAERVSYSDRLFKKIDFTKLSVEYTRRRTEIFMKELKVPSRSIHDATLPTINAFQKSTRLLHAYVSRLSQNRPVSTRIFTVKSSSIAPHFTWAYFGEVELRADFMRNIAIDDRLYSLRYSKKESTESSPRQTFSSAAEISMSPYVSLKPPPRILDEFDMCGSASEIYLYHKNNRSPIIRNTTIFSEDPIFSTDELIRGLYFYKRDIDRWFPLPSPKCLFRKACMTCDEERVYLIGVQLEGSNSNLNIQAYDPRMREWSDLSLTSYTDVELACCAFGKKIYVAGGHRNSLSLKEYDLISETWQNLASLDRSSGSEKYGLVNWQVSSSEGHSDFLLSFNRTLSSDSEISFLNPSTCVDWKRMPNLFEAEKKKVMFPRLIFIIFVYWIW